MKTGRLIKHVITAWTEEDDAENWSPPDTLEAIGTMKLDGESMYTEWQQEIVERADADGEAVQYFDDGADSE